MKHVLNQGFTVMQALAVRSWVVVPVMGIWAIKFMPQKALHTKRPKLHLLRAVLGFFAPYLFFSALITLPLADATVIVFGSTFIMTALSVPLLKEHVGKHRWIAVFLGFLGVIIATNPTGNVMSKGAVYAILASFAYALMMLLTRWMGPRESAFKQVFYLNAWLAIVASIMAFSGFKPMTAPDFFWISLTGIFSVLGHLCLTRAFGIAPIGLLAPFEYSIIIWATLIGFFAWAQVPGNGVIVGGLVVVLSGLYLFHRERNIKSKNDRNQ